MLTYNELEEENDQLFKECRILGSQNARLYIKIKKLSADRNKIVIISFISTIIFLFFSF